MKMPFSMPDEFASGWVKAGFNFWRALPLSNEAGNETGNTRKTLTQASADYWRQQTALFTSVLTSTAGGKFASQPVVQPEQGDRRFHAEDWSNNGWYSLLKQHYLITARMLEDMVEASTLDEKEKHKLRFYTRQFIDLASPTNYAATNPEVIRHALESNGSSLVSGATRLLEDMKDGCISITDRSAFEVGRSVAASEGSVVFENELFQLIQYAPLTPTVARRPLVIVPPCINKFYILDLQPDNSFVRFACEQGLTVFLVSWRNPDETMSDTQWDAYLESGVMKALEVARTITRADKVNALGWCVGGTMLSSALAVMRAKGDDTVASATLLTALLDFSEPGDLGVFIDETGVSMREHTIGRGGLYPGRELGFVFQTLRANDLIWPYVVNNYLKGKTPAAFDLLYWNADTTNLPGPMYSWYLRNMYLENSLRVPNRLRMCGTPVDLGRIDMPAYLLATEEDHIVPWRSAYQSTQLLGGDTEFVLGASGHIAGVINPASRNKRSYWTGGTPDSDAEQWLTGATRQAGSWWNHWIRWVKQHAGDEVKARTTPGSAKYKPIEPAPGRYVKVRAD
ncbi:PHA/PHB synthase family protein [Paraburkholderia sabiae]|uniref:Class I poly(R)-hydroxyalkanoic acid synthase n=1 Tax=Paraburkholderia sabiae TaxID=273251 RepID=A0ABU9Q8M1_9BURK|nr:class I poly(R)-hydroxyalkanoic acid synthase [Paraburkholderia sabiae]WJZ78342.1 class I poly(R)-hydroxyalkanoic acid synthase [Paraburkholderia sabiae]CAD6507467.1 Poly(3-hydroxyalkanoate) polymerase subunit PhaC [Paraburkholderia sabiae]